MKTNLMWQGFWNSLLLSLSFMFYLIQEHKSVFWVIIGIIATFSTAYDTVQFYKAMKENN